MHANCSSLLPSLRYVCVRRGAQVWSEGGHGENEISVCRGPCFIPELCRMRGPRRQTSNLVAPSRSFYLFTRQQNSERVREHCGVIRYSWHVHKHTHTTVCHPLSPEQINATEKSIPIRIPLLCPACGCRLIDIEILLLTCRSF